MAENGAVGGKSVSRRSGLGRGLDALLPPRDSQGLEETSSLREVAVEAIEPNPRQPRQVFEEESLEELAASISQLGILQPLLAREPSPGRFVLVAGERRLRAARQAGLRTVPVIVVETDEQGALERALVENVHRADLNPIEEAAAYRQLMDDGGLTQEALAARVGRNRVTVANMLRLLDLPLEVQRLLADRRLTAGHGKVLLRLQHSPFLPRLAVRAAQEGLSVRETEQLVNRYEEMSGLGSAGGASPRRKPAIATEVQRRLANHLQTRVRIEIGKRKGKIILDFVSLEELDRVSRAILGQSPNVVTLDEPGL
jgi:ParB family transcriptional regulator, chromosome partitioning protein